jgi:hypothetical protein
MITIDHNLTAPVHGVLPAGARAYRKLTTHTSQYRTSLESLLVQGASLLQSACLPGQHFVSPGAKENRPEWVLLAGVSYTQSFRSGRRSTCQEFTTQRSGTQSRIQNLFLNGAGRVVVANGMSREKR